jgi:hypothetical protein
MISPKVTLQRSGVATCGRSAQVPRRRRALFWGCAAAVLAFGASTAQAGSVFFTFHGQISSIDTLAVPLTSFHVGDPFTLVLDFTPDGPTPCFGYFLSPGNTGVNPENSPTTAGNDSTGIWDTTFKIPSQFQMFCTANLSLTGSVLSFLMHDDVFGPSGSVTVGSTFPSEWFSDISDPLPGGVDCIDFDARGQFTIDLSGLGVSGHNMIGDITSGEVCTQPVPLPPALLPGLLGLAGLALYRRRCLNR